MATGGAGVWRLPRTYSIGDPEKTTKDEWHRQRIRWAVIAIQRDLIRQGRLDADPATLQGGFGPKTDQAVRDFQGLHGLRADGQVGPKTAELIWRDWFEWWEAVHGIPHRLTYGICRLESALDPGAEGSVDAEDRGIAQWNRRFHPEISDEIAFSRPDLCIQRVAIDLAAAWLRHDHEPHGSWFTAVAAHNNPAKALNWARTNHADDQIRHYVELVYRATAG